MFSSAQDSQISNRLFLKTVVLFQVCLGAEAEDKFHVVEVEGLTYDAKTTKVPLVVLKPSVLPSVSQHQLSLHFLDICKDFVPFVPKKQPRV